MRYTLAFCLIKIRAVKIELFVSGFVKLALSVSVLVLCSKKSDTSLSEYRKIELFDRSYLGEIS